VDPHGLLGAGMKSHIEAHAFLSLQEDPKTLAAAADLRLMCPGVATANPNDNMVALVLYRP
jgi:hypothetical protein